MRKLIGVLAALFVLLLIIDIGGSFWKTFSIVLLLLVALPCIIYGIWYACLVIARNQYFSSEQFQTLKAQIASVVAEHNDVADYVDQIRATGSFELGKSSSGQYAHLASFENTSTWNNRRDRYVAEYAPHIHNTSLQVVRNASAEPIKYLMKYFGITANQDTLADVQRVADDISRLEEALGNIEGREDDITDRIDPPAFILKHWASQFWAQIGVHLSSVEVPYPVYKFQYTSAGGNSSQTTTITLNTATLEVLSQTLVDKIRWTKSTAGQRALMTTQLREAIKRRDHYACLKCGVSLAVEPHLLLEIDHIIPVSKGGLSVPENLQTLCWKCNRSKGSRIQS